VLENIADNFESDWVDPDEVPLEELKKQIAELGEDILEEKGLPPPWVKFRKFSDAGKTSNNNIRLNNITIAVPGQTLIQNCTITLSYGTKYGLVGRNGSGKTTLMKHIIDRTEGFEIPKHLSILLVEQEVVGEDISAIESVLKADREREWLLQTEKKINQETEQDIEKRRYYTIRDIHERLREIESDKAFSRASSILMGLGFNPEEQKKPTKEFSGGWRMRIALARALFFKPDVLMLDEPTNHLDLYAVIWLENYLTEKFKGTILMTSHERDFLNNTVDSIVHLHMQTLTVYRGDYEKFWKQWKANQRANNAKFEKLQKNEKQIKKAIGSKTGKQVVAEKRKLEDIKKNQVVKDVEEKAPRFDFPEPDNPGYPILQFINVTFSFGDKLVLKDVDFGIDLQSRVGLVGPNGAGKSTLMNLMGGQLEPDKGEVKINRKLRIARFTQHHIDQLDLNVTPIEHLQKCYPTAQTQDVRNHLARFGLIGKLPVKPIGQLSGGQKSRVSFAELAWNQPHILFLDEPTNHLDMETIDALSKSLKEFKGGMVLITHNTRILSHVCNEIWVVKDHKVTSFEGSFVDYKNDLIQEILSDIDKEVVSSAP